jgi:YD repeat-containing protein
MNTRVLLARRCASSSGRLTGSAIWAIPLVGALLLTPPAAARADLRLGIALSGTNVVLTWTNPGALLQSSLSVTGGWQLVVGAASPYSVPATNPASFFRLLAVTAPNFEFRYVAPTFATLIGGPVSNCGCASPENPYATVTDGNAEDNGQGLVLLPTGELVQRAVDLEIPGRGFNWRLERAYRSGMNYDGPLGRGWEFTQNRRLVVQTNGNVLRVDGSGRADLYVAGGGGFQSPSGFYTRLTLNLDGTFQEREPHGTLWLYSRTNDLGIAALTTMLDRNSNTMSFSYNAAGQLTNVTDTLGRPLSYRYDANGRLVSVVDFTGRTVSYGYNTNGDLISVTSPVVTNTPNGNDFPAGKTVLYTYSSGFADVRLNHQLLTVTAPNESSNGPPRLSAQYNTNSLSPNAGRLVSLLLGGTNASGVGAGGTIYYAYLNLAAAGSNDFASPVAQNTVTNRNSNVTQYQFNQLGNAVSTVQFTRGLRAGDPPSFTTTRVYNRDGALLARTSPAGNSVVYAYDSANPDRLQQGNVLQSQRLAGPPGGDQATLTTSYAYEPFFNFMATNTDGRGNTTSYAYDSRGNRTNIIYRIPSITETFQYNSFGQVTLHVLPDKGNGDRRQDVFNYYSRRT